jgi:hypothetical protein
MRQLGSLAALTLLGQSFCFDKSNDVSYATRQLSNSAARQLGSFTNSDNAITWHLGFGIWEYRQLVILEVWQLGEFATRLIINNLTTSKGLLGITTNNALKA